MKGKVSSKTKQSSSHLRRRDRNINAFAELQTVMVKVIFSRLLDIDTMSQQFEADVYVQARWTEHQFAGMSEKELNAIDFSRCHDPKLTILNKACEFDSEKKSIMIQYEDEEMDPVVTLMWRIRGMFRENLELSHFPFDVQEMSIVISSERAAAEIDLQPDPINLSNVSPGALTESHEWTLFRHVEFTKDFTTTEFITFSKHPVLLASCHAQRHIGFYMWNIVVIVLLILCLTLTVLSVDPTGTDRLTVTITLFLTAVAFKLVVKTTLPTISYLTYLDVYMVFTLMYLATQAWENAIMTHLARFREREQVVEYDEVAQAILIAILILFHAVFLVYIQLTMAKMKQKMLRQQSRKSYAGNRPVHFDPDLCQPYVYPSPSGLNYMQPTQDGQTINNRQTAHSGLMIHNNQPTGAGPGMHNMQSNQNRPGMHNMQPNQNGPGMHNMQPNQNGPGMHNMQPNQNGPGMHNTQPNQNGPGMHNMQPNQNGPAMHNMKPNQNWPVEHNMNQPVDDNTSMYGFQQSLYGR